jgi:hypothetical protein
MDQVLGLAALFYITLDQRNVPTKRGDIHLRTLELRKALEMSSVQDMHWICFRKPKWNNRRQYIHPCVNCLPQWGLTARIQQIVEIDLSKVPDEVNKAMTRRRPHPRFKEGDTVIYTPIATPFAPHITLISKVHAVEWNWGTWQWEYHLLIPKKELNERRCFHPFAMNDLLLHPEQALEKVCISEFYEFVDIAVLPCDFDETKSRASDA